MNIYLPIITNLIILGILTLGFFIGKKNGFKVQLAKFILLLPFMVGCYFLQPVITEQLLKIEFLSNISTLAYGHELISSLVLFVLFIVSYALIVIAGALVKKATRKDLSVNRVKAVKVKGVSRKETRQLRREQKKLERLNKPQLKTKSKVAGALLGIVISLFAGFMFMLPVKYVTYGTAELYNSEELPEEERKPELEQLKTAYDYTLIGQLDKVTNEKLSSFILKK